MLVTLLGIATLVRLLHPPNVPVADALVTLLGDRHAGQAAAILSNAPAADAGDAGGDRHAGQAGAAREQASPMLVTLVGIATLARPVH